MRDKTENKRILRVLWVRIWDALPRRGFMCKSGFFQGWGGDFNYPLHIFYIYLYLFMYTLLSKESEKMGEGGWGQGLVIFGSLHHSHVICWKGVKNLHLESLGLTAQQLCAMEGSPYRRLGELRSCSGSSVTSTNQCLLNVSSTKFACLFRMHIS